MPALTVLAAVGGNAGCSSTINQGIYPSPEIDAGIQTAADGGIQAQPDDAGDDGSIQVAEAGGGIQALDAGASDAADDGGGPHRGTPELPASFVSLLA
jgi:hypothetical protein